MKAYEKGVGSQFRGKACLVSDVVTANPTPDPLRETPITTAAIFDFDGTLVDTMPLHYEAYRLVFKELGIDLSRSDFYDNIGGTARETIPKFLRGRAATCSTEEIHTRKKTAFAQLLATVPIPVLETAKLLDVMHGKYKIALASSGSRLGIEHILHRLNWVRYFDAIVTGEDAARGKPAPDLFLIAAEHLKVAPAECIVFEDTDAGVLGAVNAGMRVFDVRKTAVESGA